jgi:UDP-N-acetylglucosamine 4-epimerase
MSEAMTKLEARLREEPQRWLVTGAAGFIGSHLVTHLLRLGQHVVGLDDFSTGRRSNLAAIMRDVGTEGWARFTMIEGDIRDPAACGAAVDGVQRVLHQAALGSVPRSIEQPEATHSVNVDGFVNMALAASRAGVQSFVYASSSSVYGDHPALPKVEPQLGRPVSPYAASKRIDEVYAEAFAACYDLHGVGLRYFNVVGPRQDPNGAYAAVVPRWLALLEQGERPAIFGDGETSRDFCPIENVVQANLLAAFSGEAAAGRAFNVALGGRTTLNELFTILRDGMAERGAPCAGIEPSYGDFRKGDIRHSHADISAAREALGYEPTVSLSDGLGEAMDAFRAGDV